MSAASHLLNGSFEEMRSALDLGEVSSQQLTEESLRRAHASQTDLNAMISFCDKEALQAAEEADRRLKAGERGAVLGIPIVVKDLILTRGHLTTAASKILANFVAPYDATVTSKLRAGGAPIIAKSNLDEFAMGSSNETSFFGPCRNPWRQDRVPGGSSGGSAASVAARISPLALGTDTGGSIRQPASFCGITGIKPTYGRVSRSGVVAFASSLDQVGPMTSDALAAAAVLETISGRDAGDATSSVRKVPRFLSDAKAARDLGNLRGLKIGLPREYFEQDGLDRQIGGIVRHSLDVLTGLGAELVNVSLPHMKYALPVYYLICTSEASSNLERYDGIHFGYRTPHLSGGNLEHLYSRTRGEGFGDEVKRRILLGTYALSAGYFDAFYKKASQVRTLIRRDYEEAFKYCDVIAGPTSPTSAFAIGAKIEDPLAMYLADIYTLSTNLAGIPALSMNAGFDEMGLPVGVQLQGSWWEESLLLGISALFQSQYPEPQKLSPYATKWIEGAAS